MGKISINKDTQFTTNRAVVLSVAGANSGAGITAMRFSNDGRTWSQAEAYRTTKQWELSEPVYPPRMNTTLKTVYVQFRKTTGEWTKAVTDSIVFARSPADVPQIKEIWITQQRPSDYSAAQPPGSRRNPHVVPRTNNEPVFDALMYSLMTNYASYYPKAYGTNVPGPATNATTLTLHLGPGVYETHGDQVMPNPKLAWSPHHGWRIIGAGKNATVLKAVHYRRGDARSVIGCYSLQTKGIGGYDNFEISDLTIDANLHEGGTNYQLRAALCMSFVGNNVQIRRAKAKNASSTIAGYESMLIQMHNFGAEPDGTHNVIVEDCDIVQAQVGNLYRSGMLGICGQYGSSGRIHEYVNIVVRNCYIDGAAYDGDTKVDPSLYDVADRGRFGIGVGGSRNAVVEDNLVMNVGTGFYVDSVSLHDVQVSSNHLRDVCFGFDVQLMSSPGRTNRVEDTLRFAGNLVELDPRHFPAGETFGTLAWRVGFRTIGNLRGPDVYTFNRVVVENNVFQFTDRKEPHPDVLGCSAGLEGVKNAQVRSNLFIGTYRAFTWNNNGYLLSRQADVLDASQPPPVDACGNRWQDGTILEPYPYVLDKAIPRPVIAAGREVVFEAPFIGGARATIASGATSQAFIDADGNFRWKTAPRDAGTYVVSFYADAKRLQDPRRTMITLLPPWPITDDRWFAAGLAGYWKLDAVEGNWLPDTSGNGAHIDLTWPLRRGLAGVGRPGITSDGLALRLNLASKPGWGLVIPNLDPQVMTGLSRGYQPFAGGETNLFHPFTLAFWFKADSAPASGGSLVWCGPFTVYAKCHPKDPGLLALNFWDHTSDLTATTATNITVGAWHQLATVYDGVSMRLYVDGRVGAEDSFGQLTGWDPKQWLGVGNDGCFDGDFDEMALWGRTLSATEIQRLYEMQLAGVQPSMQPLNATGLRVSALPDGTLRLDWDDNASNENGYLIERSSDGVNFTLAGNAGRNGTSFLDTPEVDRLLLPRHSN